VRRRADDGGAGAGRGRRRARRVRRDAPVHARAVRRRDVLASTVLTIVLLFGLIGSHLFIAAAIVAMVGFVFLRYPYNSAAVFAINTPIFYLIVFNDVKNVAPVLKNMRIDSDNLTQKQLFLFFNLLI
jgi:hypothetical protein